MESKYLVATGAVIFTQYASSARQALLLTRARLEKASELPANSRDPKRVSESLSSAQAAGRLNFLVMDSARSRLICGEFHGKYEDSVSLELASHFQHLIPAATLQEHRAGWYMQNSTGSYRTA